MTSFSSDMAYIRQAELLHEAERVNRVSRDLRERNVTTRDRVARRGLRPLQQVHVLGAALLAGLR